MAGSWASSEGVRACMRSNRGRDTKPEVALRSAVYRLGLRYRVSAAPIKGLRRTADLVFPAERVAVFLDGCFWHGCPEHHTVAATNVDYWARKVIVNRSRDRNTDERLTEAGWLSLRIWEHEVAKEAAARVRDVILARRQGHGA